MSSWRATPDRIQSKSVILSVAKNLKHLKRSSFKNDDRFFYFSNLINVFYFHAVLYHTRYNHYISSAVQLHVHKIKRCTRLHPGDENLGPYGEFLTTKKAITACKETYKKLQTYTNTEKQHIHSSNYDKDFWRF